MFQARRGDFTEFYLVEATGRQPVEVPVESAVTMRGGPACVIPEHAMPRTETEMREHFERAFDTARQERALPSGLMLTLDVIGLLREIVALSGVPETLVERARAAFEDQSSGAFAAAERERIIAHRLRNS